MYYFLAEVVHFSIYNIMYVRKVVTQYYGKSYNVI